MGEILLWLQYLCTLFRQHDMRFSLNQLQVVQEREPLYHIAQQMVDTVTFSEPGTLDFVAYTDQWTVSSIRHKK